MSGKILIIVAPVVTAFSGAYHPASVTCLSAPSPLTPACEKALEQSPADVTSGSTGLRDPAGVLITDFADANACMVNVHWHLGAEHYSDSEYHLMGKDFVENTWVVPGEPAGAFRRLLEADEPDSGYQCSGYDENDPKFTTPYDWKYCEGMHVGLTYEVHWPHSSAGNCGHLVDGLAGVFCKSTTPSAIGVQAQVYVVVNDAAYDVEDMTLGMNTTMAQDVIMYTGSTTGSSYNNLACSPFGGISWHVDRECHMVSAKSFDQMCKVMKEKHGMIKDLEPHGSRVIVDPAWVSSVPMVR